MAIHANEIDVRTLLAAALKAHVDDERWAKEKYEAAARNLADATERLNDATARLDETRRIAREAGVPGADHDEW